MKDLNKHNDIMQAAMELFVEHGFHDATVAKIAQKANISVGTIYLYFENKHVLIHELYQELEDKIRFVIQKGYPFGRPVRERFFYIATTLLNYFIAHPLYFRYVDQYQCSPYGVSLRRENIMGDTDDRELFKDLFEEGIARQVLKDLPTDIIIILTLGPMLALAREHILGFITLDDVMIRQATEICWSLIKREKPILKSSISVLQDNDVKEMRER